MIQFYILGTKTYRKIGYNPDDDAAEPVKDQHKQMVGGWLLELIRLQSTRVAIQEEAVQQEVESSHRIQRVEQDAG